MLYKHNPAEFRRLYRKDSATAVTPLVPSLNPADYAYSHPSLNEGAESNVKEALDALLSATFVVPPSWATYEKSGTFEVPAGVEEVLLLSIGAGGVGQELEVTYSGSVTWGGSGGYAVSAYFNVTPGSLLPVTISSTTSTAGAVNTINNIRIDSNSPNLILLKQAGRGAGGYKNPNGTAVGSLICKGGGAGGGFAIPVTDDERKAWLDVALNKWGDGAPENGTAGTKTAFGQGGLCWPDTTRRSGNGGTSAGGNGYGYGAGSGGGPNKNGSGDPGTPGPGVVMIFWGNDIRPQTAQEGQ